MSISKLVDIVYSSSEQGWFDNNKTAFDGLFGAAGGRYPKQAEKVLTLRAPEMQSDGGIRFAAYIHPENPTSGKYSGLSFVIFPAKDAPCLVGLGVGTLGLSPDEQVLGRPGHARKLRAICAWLNRDYGEGRLAAWAKMDPTRTDIPVPDNITSEWNQYKTVFERYGSVMYALFRPTANRDATEKALTAFLDIVLEERGFWPLTSASGSAENIRRAWLAHMLPSWDVADTHNLLI